LSPLLCRRCFFDRQLIQSYDDLLERESDLLGYPNECEPSQYIATEESLVARRPLRMHEASLLVEANGGRGEAAAFSDFTNRKQIIHVNLHDFSQRIT
jgi:hypothetical protein